MINRLRNGSLTTAAKEMPAIQELAAKTEGMAGSPQILMGGRHLDNAVASSRSLAIVLPLPDLLTQGAEGATLARILSLDANMSRGAVPSLPVAA